MQRLQRIATRPTTIALVSFIIPLAILAGLVVINGCSGRPEGFDNLKAAGMDAYFDADYAQAREYFLEALKENPSEKETLYFTGLAYRRDFLLDSALIYLKRADLYSPDDRELNQILYEVAAAVGEWEYAKDAVMVLVRTGDPIEQHYGELVDLWSNLGSTVNTFWYLRKMYRETAIELPEEFLQLAGLAAQGDSLELANKVLDSARARFGDNDQFLFIEGKIRFYERNLTEAERILRSLHQAFPDNPDYKINLANALANQQTRPKRAEALSLYREVRDVVPNPAQVDSLITRMETQLEADAGK